MMANQASLDTPIRDPCAFGFRYCRRSSMRSPRARVASAPCRCRGYGLVVARVQGRNVAAVDALGLTGCRTMQREQESFNPAEVAECFADGEASSADTSTSCGHDGGSSAGRVAEDHAITFDYRGASGTRPVAIC